MEARDIHDILRLLPHRQPFLLIDRVLQWRARESLTAVKHFSAAEPFFTGHFGARPRVPPALILEAMAQAAGLLALLGEARSTEGLAFYLAGIDGARFGRLLVPGDRLLIEIRFLGAIREVWKLAAEARVGEEWVAGAELMCAARAAGVP